MSVQGELKGGWVYMSLWEWNTKMPKWCLALTRPPFQQEQNIYNTGFTAESSLYNPNLGPVPQPCSASQCRLELPPNLSAHSVFMCLLFVWGFVLFAPKWLFTLLSARDSSDYESLEKKSRQQWLPLLCQHHHLLPQVYFGMPRLSNNLQLIKYVAFIISFLRVGWKGSPPGKLR